ncbi:hypothetical protein I6M42_16800 [Shewanella algae]|uniref:hypothetical protein n=1 Tax=Shewanella algae TaxID=38313 RepID=UPI001AAE7F20|nr:hypothetical protein [Shewanella algae]MBO2638287.1 hypothetical protein [Shewanella algae]
MESSDIIALVAVFISVLALAATFWQAHSSRRHNILSVRPRLSSSNNVKQKSDKIEYSISNKGLGPAIITYFGISIDGKHQNLSSIQHGDDIKAIFSKLGINLDQWQWAMSVHDSESTISSGETALILGFYNCLENEESYEALRNTLPRLRFHIKYMCMYGNTYEVHG